MSVQNDFVFAQPALPTQHDGKAASDTDIIFKQFQLPAVKLQLIKQRDRYAPVSAASNHEREVDEILTSAIGDDPSFISQVHLVSPTFKTISIHKMLNDVVRIPETGNADRWSGFHSEYARRLQHVNICTFLKYLWYEQLLNQSGMARPTICKTRLDRYARGILSNLDTASCRDPVDVANIVDHIAFRFRDDIEAIVTSSVDAFTDTYELRRAFQLFLEWHMIVGAVPYQKRVQTDSMTWNRIKRGNTLFASTAIKELLTTRNRIPAFSEVCVVLKGGDAEFYHLPSKERLDLLGTCEFRVENHEICIASKGESLLYAELNMRRLADMHYRSQCQSMQRYVLVEQQGDERKKSADKRPGNDDEDQSPLFQTLTKTQTQVFDENNPLSISSRMHDRGNALKEYVSRVTTEMDDLEAKMIMFLDELSPESHSTFVDDMVQEGLESYFKKLKPKLDDWERTVRDHLNKFRLHAVKQLATLPRGLYEYQERAAELNVENNMDVEEFIEELSSTSVARNLNGVPNISTLQDLDQTEIDVKQMQEKMSQYFDLATKFMDHLRDAQRVVAKLRLDDSVKELHIKALTQQKNEIVALASKFRRAADKRVDVYKDRLKSTNRELERYVHSQNQTMAQTKRHFLNIRDQLVTNGGQWVDALKKKRDKREERERMLRENFIKQYDSTTLDREPPSASDIEFVRADGAVRHVHLDARIDEGAVSFNRDALKQYWQSRLSTVVDIQQSVTKNGIQIHHVNEDHLLHTFVKPFLQIVYGRQVYVSVNSLEQCCRVYGIDIAVNATVKKLLLPKTESTTTTVIRQRDDDGANHDDVGIILDN